MRNLLNLVLAGLAVLLLSAQAQAILYTGTLELGVGTLDPFIVAGSADGASTPGNVNLGAANFTTNLSVPVSNATAMSFPAFPIVSLALTGPAGLTQGDFNAGGGPAGGFGGNAGLAGNAKIGLFGPPPFAFLTVPLAAFGNAGSSAMVASPLGVNITAFGSGWTTGQVKVIGTTGPFDGATLATVTGADNRTAGGAGTIVLVTPTLAKTNVAGSENLPLVGILTLNFVPEPGTLMLLGSGVAGLAMLGRRRENR